MSTFEVKTRTIDVLEPHPNADRLELVVIGGYKAVVAKGVHKVGDVILYVPEDSVFVDRTIAEKLGVADYLTGKYKNRVKAIKLRGILSQGIVVPFDKLDEVTSELGFGFFAHQPNYELSDVLKIEKYEEPIPIEMMGHVRKWPSFLPHYDLENIKRPESLAMMKSGEEVVMTEKLHGTNCAVAWGPGLEEDEQVYVCSRRMALKESDTNVYWRAVKKYNLIDKLNAIRAQHFDYTGVENAPISIHGEVVGVQDLKYGYSGGDIGFYAFDISIEGEFVDYDLFANLCEEFDIPRVPELYRGPFDYDKLFEIASGKTTLGSGHIREGGVVKNPYDRYPLFDERRVFKFVSDDYLTRKGGTEMH